jgi:toxin ParE1/3/4
MAAEDLEYLYEFIAQRSLPAARRFLKYVRRTCATLAVMPYRGAAWEGSPVPALRIWPLPRYKNFVIFYRPIAAGVEILRVVRGARDFSRLFPEAP